MQTVLQHLLEGGNRVLIVSKPISTASRPSARRLLTSETLILFRFTIGAYDNALLEYWEPHAPTSRNGWPR